MKLTSNKKVEKVVSGNKVSFNPLSGMPGGNFVRAKKDPIFKKHLQLAPPEKESKARRMVNLFRQIKKLSPKNLKYEFCDD